MKRFPHRSLPARTVLYHGTSSPEDFTIPRGPAWFSDGLKVAQGFVSWHNWMNKPRPRVLVFDADAIPKLVLINDQRDMERFNEFVIESLGIEAYDPGDLANATCDLGYNGWIIPTNYPEGADIMLCEPEKWLTPLRCNCEKP